MMYTCPAKCFCKFIFKLEKLDGLIKNIFNVFKALNDVLKRALGVSCIDTDSTDGTSGLVCIEFIKTIIKIYNKRSIGNHKHA